MPLFTHPDPKAWHTLTLAQNFHHFWLVSNETTAKHVDDVWPQFNISRKMCSQMLRRALIKLDSLSWAETSTRKVLLPHVQTSRHRPSHAPKPHSHQEKKNGKQAGMWTFAEPWAQTPEHSNHTCAEMPCLLSLQRASSSQSCCDKLICSVLFFACTAPLLPATWEDLAWNDHMLTCGRGMESLIMGHI